MAGVPKHLRNAFMFYNIMYMQVPKTEPESRQPYAGDFLLELEKGIFYFDLSLIHNNGKKG